MITDPPLLTIRREFSRPPPDMLQAFGAAQSSQIVDALGGRGALDYRIRPLSPSACKTVGAALPCQAGPADNLAVFAALDAAQPGDVVIAATDAFTGTSVAGDLLIGMARNRGISGFVTDGLVRDVAGIEAVGLPVFCAGVSPNSPARSGPGHVGFAVTLGGVVIEPGDIVVGDRDGVVVVPLRRAAEVLERLQQVLEAERALEAKVRAGLQIPDFVRAVLNSDRTRIVG